MLLLCVCGVSAFLGVACVCSGARGSGGLRGHLGVLFPGVPGVPGFPGVPRLRPGHP